MSKDNIFDEKAATWDDDPVKAARTQAVANAIRQRVPLSTAWRALEYGCGTGSLSFALRAGLGHITLADSSTGMLAVLGRKIVAAGATGMLPLKLDLATDPRPDEEFDIIYSAMTFHHIEDTGKALRDLFALLASPGFLCIADLDTEDGSFHGPELDVHKGFDRGQLATLARDAGFRNVTFTTAFTMTRDDGPTRTEFPIFLMVAEKSERPEGS
jgi:ubiquinone/menaquinone biosynthesis C-methylase UbiE